MSIEANKAVVRRVVEALNALRIDDATLFGTREALEVATASVRFMSTSFEGHHIAIREMVAEDDRVWVRVGTSGRHTGEFAGIAPTGKEWTNTGVLFFRVSDGAIVDIDMLFDVLNHVTQLGATLSPPVVTNIPPRGGA
jgi:predicted ester cyclase